MDYLVDTNTAARRFVLADPQQPMISVARAKLRGQGDVLYITAQVLIEFHALATRPVAANGWGLSAAEASAEARTIEMIFPLLPESPAIYPLWRNLVDQYDIVGRQVFDARLVAVMQAHNVSHLPTMNPTHFRRFPTITVVEPSTV